MLSKSDSEASILWNDDCYFLKEIVSDIYGNLILIMVTEAPNALIHAHPGNPLAGAGLDQRIGQRIGQRD